MGACSCVLELIRASLERKLHLFLSPLPQGDHGYLEI